MANDGTRNVATRPLPTLRATYRVQMNAGFTLARLREVVPYLDRLGVSHVYTSPLLAAATSSMHGYDVVDPTRLNFELGTMDDLRALGGDLADRGMGLLLDIVPNHMSTSSQNARWMDVLARGRESVYADWFDIDWDAPDADGKIVLPVLGDTLDGVIARGELGVVNSDTAPRRAEFAYFDSRFPLRADGPPTAQTPDARALRALADAQYYRLAFSDDAVVNYRRFFDVNGLVALRMEDPSVFDAVHETALDWVGEGLVQGFRVDHVDGLRDPLAYLRRLREAVDDRASRHGAAPGAFPIVVEKILAEHEALRTEWPVQGTTGYEFLNDVEDLFVDPEGFARIESAYRATSEPETTTFAEAARAGKRSVLRNGLAPDLARTKRALSPDAGPDDDAVADLVVAMPVYRTYIASGNEGSASDADARILHEAARTADDAGARWLVQAMIEGGDQPTSAAGQGVGSEFIARLQQLSGPAAARGIEDTALYVYYPLASRNEVGGAPDRDLHRAVARFHERNAARAAQWPLGLVCTDTHDTKRGADIRARLEAVSERADEWTAAVERWRGLNARHRREVAGKATPDPNCEYLFYQTLVGVWPGGTKPASIALPNAKWFAGIQPRLREYLRKAAREAKRFTTWTRPNAEYEAALDAFIDAATDPARSAEFLEAVAAFVATIAQASAWIAAARTLLHLTAPGTPDIYQGTERSSGSLVDPDNRRPVDYAAAQRALSRTAAATTSGRFDPCDPDARVNFVSRLLGARRRSDLFQYGDYVALEATGKRAAHVVAFARVRNDECAIVATSRLLGAKFGAPIDTGWWADTRLKLPAAVHAAVSRRASERGQWYDVVRNEATALTASALGEVDIGQLFSKVALAFLTAY